MKEKLRPIYIWLMGDTLQTEKNIQIEGVVVEKVITCKRKPKESWVSEEIIAKKSPNMGKEIAIQVQEAESRTG